MKHLEKFRCFYFLGEDMNKLKQKESKAEKIWVDIPTFYKDRKCGSGLTFGGKYIVRK